MAIPIRASSECAYVAGAARRSQGKVRGAEAPPIKLSQQPLHRAWHPNVNSLRTGQPLQEAVVSPLKV